MTTAEKRAAIWEKILADDEDSEWCWLCWYRLEREYERSGAHQVMRTRDSRARIVTGRCDQGGERQS